MKGAAVGALARVRPPPRARPPGQEAPAKPGPQRWEAQLSFPASPSTENKENQSPNQGSAFKNQGSAFNIPIVCASRSEEHTSELQSLMRISYAVYCLKKKK